MTRGTAVLFVARARARRSKQVATTVEAAAPVFKKNLACVVGEAKHVMACMCVRAHVCVQANSRAPPVGGQVACELTRTHT